MDDNNIFKFFFKSFKKKEWKTVEMLHKGDAP